MSSCSLILAIFCTILFTRSSTGFLQDDDTDPLLPRSEELVQRPDDVIKVPLQEQASLKGEVVCACPETNFCDKLRCFKGIVCINPEYIGLITVGGSSVLLFVVLSAFLLGIYCTVKKPCGNICPCCCDPEEEWPQRYRRRRQRQFSVHGGHLEEVVSEGGSLRDNPVPAMSERTSSPRDGVKNGCDGVKNGSDGVRNGCDGVKNGSDGKNGSPCLQFASPVPEGQGGANKYPEVGLGSSDKKRKRKSISSDEGEDQQERKNDSNITTSENEVDVTSSDNEVNVTTSDNEQDDTRSADLTFGDSTANDSTRLIKD